MEIQKDLIPMEPGDILRQAREEAGLSVSQVAEQLNIRAAVLTSIESGETGDIASVYLRGYIRNYARFLQIDPDELEELMALAEGAEPEVQSVFMHSPDRGSADRWLKATSYVVASVLVAALVWQFTHEAVRFSQGEQKRSVSAVTPESEDRISESPAGSHVNASIASIEVIRQRGEASGTSPAEEAWAAIGHPPKSTSGPGGEDIAQEALLQEGLGLALSTSADSWVEIIDANGQHMEMDLIRAGTSRHYDGAAPFRILLGRASAVDLYLDGEKIDLGPYTRGNVVRMTLGDGPVAEEVQQTDSDQG